MKKPVVIVITGPTASGKSALAVSLAKRLQTEIISADSRQIYKGIPIVTAVPSEEEKEGIKHHLMEIMPLEAYYSASKFEEDSDSILRDIFKERDSAVVCGGSMMYIDTLIYGIDELPTVPDDIRMQLTEDWIQKGDEWLLSQLRDLDPAYFEKVDLRNLKRVFHAVEISITADRPYSSLLSGTKNPPHRDFDIVKVCLNGNRDHLFERINSRVIKMVEQGLEEEARNVYPLRHLNSLNTVGLKEMFAYFEGRMTLTEAIARIQKNTRVYAKKQLTWHKRDPNIINLDFEDPPTLNSEKILNLIKK